MDASTKTEEGKRKSTFASMHVQIDVAPIKSIQSREVGLCHIIILGLEIIIF